MNKYILGTVQMGLDYGISNSSGKIPFEETCDILNTAYSNGIEMLDTAEAYGDAHKAIGDFHKRFPNIRFKIITKIPHSKLDNVEERIHLYLKDLNISTFEVLMFHSFDSYLLNADVIDFLVHLKEKEMVKHIGVSVYTNKQIEALLNDDRITLIQLPFNLLDNEPIRGSLLQQLKNKGKIVHTRSAFLQGLFFKNASEKNETYEKLATEIETLKKIAKAEKTTISNLALSYCLSQKNIDHVLIGVDSVSQLEENIKGSKYVITNKAISEINAIKVADQDLLNPSLWK